MRVEKEKGHFRYKEILDILDIRGVKREWIILRALPGLYLPA